MSRSLRTLAAPSAAALLTALFAVALPPVPAAADDGAKAGADPRAAEVAAKLMTALGGEQAWSNAHFIHFTFAGRRTHTWDKWTGRHRLEGKTKDGEPYVVLEDVTTHQGRAWVAGRELSGDEAAKMVENSYGAWVNDTYWLLMPYKLRDPGVILRYDGEETIDGVAYDRLALSFEHVGLTPGDRYWAWINRDTGLMDRWAYVLEDQPADAAPTAWLWQGWKKFGGVMLAPVRQQVGGDHRLEMTDLAVTDSLPDAVFESPDGGATSAGR